MNSTYDFQGPGFAGAGGPLAERDTNQRTDNRSPLRMKSAQRRSDSKDKGWGGNGSKERLVEYENTFNNKQHGGVSAG